MWSLDQLMTFKLVAEKQNFSKTARALNISTAAVGKQIKNLESEIGSQLFYRTTRRVMLTEVGKAFFQHCQSILAEIDKTQGFLAAQKNEVQGKLKIISSVAFGETHIVPHLKALLSRYPHLIMDLELSDRIPNIEMEEIDLLIGLMSGLPAHYTARRLKEVSYRLYASPGYLKKFGEPKTPNDLSSHAFITHSKRPNPSTLVFNNKETVCLQPKIFTNSTFTMLRCCLDGLGIAMFHSDNVETALKEKHLIEILRSFRQPTQSLYLYYKTVQYLQPKLRCFIDFLIEKINPNVSTDK